MSRDWSTWCDPQHRTGTRPTRGLIVEIGGQSGTVSRVLERDKECFLSGEDGGERVREDGGTKSNEDLGSYSRNRSPLNGRSKKQVAAGRHVRG